MKRRKLRLLTLGVYGFSEAQFFERLAAERVDLFVDIRARRGMRGSEYAFVNSTRLQARLAEMGIAYLHLKELAPTPGIRSAQAALDIEAGEKKRQRAALNVVFVSGYQDHVLRHFDFHLLDAPLAAGYRTWCLFCVEREPAACHRSLAAPYLADYLDARFDHLT